MAVTTPAPSPSSSPSARRRQAVEALASAAAAIGPIEPGMSLFLVTRGQFSMIDMVHHVLSEIGPSDVSIWTWCVADYEISVMAGFMASRGIKQARLIVDRSAEQRTCATIEEWRQRFGADQVRVCKNHAKIARVWNDRFKVLIRGSSNLNWNARFENQDITEGGPEFDLVARLEDELPVLRPMCSNAEAEAASGLGKAFEQSTLAMFSGAKPWAK